MFEGVISTCVTKPPGASHRMYLLSILQVLGQICVRAAQHASVSVTVFPLHLQNVLIICCVLPVAALKCSAFVASTDEFEILGVFRVCFDVCIDCVCVCCSQSRMLSNVGVNL